LDYDEENYRIILKKINSVLCFIEGISFTISSVIIYDNPDSIVDKKEYIADIQVLMCVDAIAGYNDLQIYKLQEVYNILFNFVFDIHVCVSKFGVWDLMNKILGQETEDHLIVIFKEDKSTIERIISLNNALYAYFNHVCDIKLDTNAEKENIPKKLPIVPALYVFNYKNSSLLTPKRFSYN
jgi:hypothetical protein